MTNSNDEVVIGRNANSMIWISSLSNFFSWVILVVLLGIGAFQIYGSVQQGVRFGLSGQQLLITVYTILNWLLFPMVAIAMFLLLQAASKVLLMLMDILDTTGASVEDEDVDVVVTEQP